MKYKFTPKNPTTAKECDRYTDYLMSKRAACLTKTDALYDDKAVLNNALQQVQAAIDSFLEKYKSYGNACFMLLTTTDEKQKKEIKKYIDCYKTYIQCKEMYQRKYQKTLDNLSAYAALVECYQNEMKRVDALKNQFEQKDCGKEL